MALVDATFSAALKTIFDAMSSASSGTPKNNQYFADQLAAAIDTQIKTATVNVTSVSGVTAGGVSSGPGSGTLS